MAAVALIGEIELDKTEGYCNGCWENKYCFTVPCPSMKGKEIQDQLHKYCEGCLVTNFKMQMAENRVWECGMRVGDGTLCNYKMTNLDQFTLSENSQIEIDSLMAKVYVSDQTDIQICPNEKCQAPCRLVNPADQVIVCQMSDCNTSFCFYCTSLQKSAKCQNQDCNLSGISGLLAASPQIMMYGNTVKGPQIRICPKCGYLMDHVSGCKHSTCPNCKYAFCHICLVENSKWGVAPCISHTVQCPIAPPQAAGGREVSKRDLKYNDL